MLERHDSEEVGDITQELGDANNSNSNMLNKLV